MKITKQEAIQILNSIKLIEQLGHLDSLGYIFLRNTILLENIEKEHTKISEFLKKEFVKENVDESKLTDEIYSKEVNNLFVNYINQNKDLSNFLNEEIDIDFITTDLEKIKDEKFKSSLVKNLLGKIIIQ